MIVKLVGWIVWPLTWAVQKIFGKKLWNWLFIKLMNQAPRIWGGKYGSKKHGRLSRDWAYKLYAQQRDQASKTPLELDDNAIEWVCGFFFFDIEEKCLLGQLEQALAELNNNRHAMGMSRIAEAIRALKGETK